MPIDVKSDDMGDVIKDFYKSDAPQFKGKSKKKRRQMAIAAKLSAEDGVNEETFKEKQAAARKRLALNKKAMDSGKPHQSPYGKHLKPKYAPMAGDPWSTHPSDVKAHRKESFDSNYDRSEREEREFRQRDLRMKHGKNWKEFTKDAKMGDSLRPGEVKRYDKKRGKWVSNKD